MKYKATGIIKEVFSEQQISATFKKREIAIDIAETGDNYPNPVKFEALQDKCQYLDSFKSGDMVQVEFYVSGREWVNPQGETKYFNSLKVAYIQSCGNSEAQESPAAPAFEPPTMPALSESGAIEDSDVPF